jgi:hypothetical protein
MTYLDDKQKCKPLEHPDLRVKEGFLSSEIAPEDRNQNKRVLREVRLGDGGY